MIFWKARSAGQAWLERKAMIDRSHELPVSRQAKVLNIRRGSVYYRPRPVSAADLAIMRRMGIEALYRRPNTSKPAVGHTIYPYLLRGLKAERPNQVWAADITYIPMARGFAYLHRRRRLVRAGHVLSHRVSITLEAGFRIEALEEALAKHGKPPRT